MQDEQLQGALSRQRESRTVEFKRSFDTSSPKEWCGIVKDIVAIANTDGGFILFGVDGHGSPVGDPPKGVLSLDPAVITDRIRAYTGVNFDSFEIVEGSKNGQTIAALFISEAHSPIAFNKPGTYALPDGKHQGREFSEGTVYFRHGAKSEPATSADLERAIERRLAKVRRELLSGVRKVMTAPRGSAISVLPPEVRQSSEPSATPIRLTDDPEAPEYHLVNPDATYPLRQKEVLANINRQLPRGIAINQFDILAVKYVYDLPSKPEFYYKSRFAAPQYSNEFVSWLLKEYRSNREFFTKCRVTYKTSF